MKWCNEGEKNASSLINVEKRNYRQRTIGQLKVSDNNFLTVDQEILSEAKNFFKDLDTSLLTDHTLLNTSSF